MTKFKEKRIAISSVVDNLLPSGLCDGEPERAESRADGFFCVSHGVYSITLSEDSEGGRINTEVLIEDGGKITVKRSGAIESEMVFCEGLLHKSLYGVPPYSFECEIKTKKIRKNLTQDGGSVEIFYDMKIGGAQKRVKMRIEC